MVDGLEGDDTVTISGALNFSSGSLDVSAESITVDSTAVITNIGDVTLTALADDDSGTLTAEVFVDGDITSTGQVTISAQVDNEITTTSSSATVVETTTSSAKALIRSGALLNADSLSLTAYSDVDISVTTTTDALVASLDVASTQTTHAGIAGGATVNVGTGEIDMVAGRAEFARRGDRYLGDRDHDRPFRHRETDQQGSEHRIRCVYQ